MRKVYILYEERESSQQCGIKGVWDSKEKAIMNMQEAIKNNSLYSDYSKIDLKAGCSQSDPTYSEDAYCDYNIESFDIF